MALVGGHRAQGRRQGGTPWSRAALQLAGPPLRGGDSRLGAGAVRRRPPPGEHAAVTTPLAGAVRPRRRRASKAGDSCRTSLPSMSSRAQGLCALAAARAAATPRLSAAARRRAARMHSDCQAIGQAAICSARCAHMPPLGASRRRLLRREEAAPAAVRADVGCALHAVGLAHKALLHAAVGQQHVAQRQRRLDAVAQEDTGLVYVWCV